MQDNPKTRVALQMEFAVIEEAPVSLLGLTAGQQLGLTTVHHEKISAVHQCGVIGSTFFRHSRASLTKDALLERFKSVFDGGLGEIPGLVHLELDTSVSLVIIPLRRVPIAVRDRLEEKLVRLEELDVISKVSARANGLGVWIRSCRKEGQLTESMHRP